MQLSHAFVRVFRVSLCPLARKSGPFVRYPPLRDVEVHGAPELLVAATDRGALLARGKLCRGPAIAAPWFNRTGDEPAARVVTSARTCSARVSPKLKR